MENLQHMKNDEHVNEKAEESEKHARKPGFCLVHVLSNKARGFHV